MDGCRTTSVFFVSQILVSPQTKMQPSGVAGSVWRSLAASPHSSSLIRVSHSSTFRFKSSWARSWNRCFSALLSGTLVSSVKRRSVVSSCSNCRLKYRCVRWECTLTDQLSQADQIFKDPAPRGIQCDVFAHNLKNFRVLDRDQSRGCGVADVHAGHKELFCGE